MKFYTSVEKGLKLAVRKFWANSYVWRSYREKTGTGRLFGPLCWIGLKVSPFHSSKLIKKLSQEKKLFTYLYQVTMYRVISSRTTASDYLSQPLTAWISKALSVTALPQSVSCSTKKHIFDFTTILCGNILFSLIQSVWFII